MGGPVTPADYPAYWADDDDAFDSPDPLDFSRLLPLSTSSLAVSATHVPAACADSTIFFPIDFEPRRLAVVGRRFAPADFEPDDTRAEARGEVFDDDRDVADRP